MKHRLHLSVLFVFIISLFLITRAEAQSPLGTGFTYQGYLAIDGTPANGNCDFQFSLWDALTSGTQIGSTLPKDSVLVTDGVFSVTLDFGAGAFNGEKRWLEAAVRCPAGSGSYTTLSPRQELSAEGYSLYSLNSDKLDGQDASAFALVGHTHTASGWNLTGNSGTMPGTNYIGTSDNQALEIKVNGLRISRLEPNATSPNIINGYSANWITAGVYGATISGSGATGAFNRVTDSYGVIAGGIGNQAGDNAGSATDRAYATVGGGYLNTASGVMSTLSGGQQNTAGGQNATIGGGYNNSANGSYSVVPGGTLNSAAGDYSLAAGRRAKTNHQGAFVWADSTAADFASTAADQFAVRASGGVIFDIGSGNGLRLLPDTTSPNIIGGYSGNLIFSGVYGAVVAGGGYSSYANWVTDNYGTVSGGSANQAGDGSGTTMDRNFATVSGGTSNKASGIYSSICGGGSNTASGSSSTVNGGSLNTASGTSSTVVGGSANIAAGTYSLAAGYRAKANHSGAFVWADSTNADFTSSADNTFNIRANGGIRFITNGAAASVDGNTIWHAGNDGTGSTMDADLLDGQHSAAFWNLSGNSGTTSGTNYIGTSDNQALEIKVNNTRVLRLEPNATSPNIIGGFSGNWITSGVWGAFIGGGGLTSYTNRVTDIYGTVAGGRNNQAGNNSGTVYDRADATVSGGFQNTASGYDSTVGGGAYNIASGDDSTVSGGSTNTASGLQSTVCGGASNQAVGDYSFACGYAAVANGLGSFVWADHSSITTLTNNVDNLFLVRASGGVEFFTNSTLTSGVYVPNGGNAWSSVSDRNMKDNFAGVNGERLLENLAAIPISTWNYKSQDESIRHIGPMAQDFYAAFDVGEDNLHISTIDADGVALAGVQALYAENQALKERIEKLEAEQGGGATGAKGLTGLLPWLLFGGLVLLNAGFILGRKFPGGLSKN